MALAFSGLSFILCLAHHFANFCRSLRKRFAANCNLLIAAYSAVSSANWDLNLVCGDVLADHSRTSEKVKERCNLVSHCG